MFKRIREQFGTAGLVVAIVAMVVAAAGTAIAAGGLTKSQEKQVTKIAKKFAGKDGEKGATGATGAQGAKGDPGAQGAKGDPGAPGAKGDPGEPGEEGKSPEGFPFAAGSPASVAHCGGMAGVEYEVEGSGEPHYVCDGKEGSPWTAGGTLPPNATETGAWAITGTEAETEGIAVPISFSVPLPFPLKSAHVHYGEPNEGGVFSATGACPSTTASNPKAKPGELCVYIGREPEATLAPPPSSTSGIFPYFSGVTQGASRAGAVLVFLPLEPVVFCGGTFAVTSCKEKVGQSECE